MARLTHVVITEGRVFAFGNADLAHKFKRRAERLPSQRGRAPIEVVTARMFLGRRFSPASIRARHAAFVATCEAEARAYFATTSLPFRVSP